MYMVIISIRLKINQLLLLILLSGIEKMEFLYSVCA